MASDAARFIYQNDNLLRVPDQMFGYTIYGGPNFVLASAEASSVPEPASFAFVLGGVAGLVFVAAEKNRQLANNTNGVRVICGWSKITRTMRRH